MSFGYFAYPNKVDSSIIKNKESNEIYNFFKQAENDLNSFRIYALEQNENLFYPEINMLYGLSAINAYGPIWLKNYQILTGFKAESKNNISFFCKIYINS
jgi:hypothetical protein